MAKVTKMASWWLMIGCMLSSAGVLANEQNSCWLADQDSGVLEFSGITEGRAFDGVFESFNVRLCLRDHDLSTADIEVSVETSSANTDSRDRDQTLRGEEFFWAAQFPTATWISQSIQPSDGALSHTAEGQLSLRDIRLNQPVDMSLIDSDNGPRLVGQASILRLDYNVGIGEFADTDFINNEVKLTFDLSLKPET